MTTRDFSGFLVYCSVMTSLDAIYYLSTGMLLGLAAGIAPGPLLTLVITESLKYGKKEGIKVGCAPLLTDVPIILVSVLLLAEFSQSRIIFGIISFLGGLFVGYLAYENLTVKEVKVSETMGTTQSLKKGVITNFLNPHPYLFWITVGSPLMFKAKDISMLYPFYFLFGFYLMLVGSKFVIAIVVSRSKTFLSSSIYLNLVRLLGIGLLIFAIFFLKDSMTYLGILK